MYSFQRDDASPNLSTGEELASVVDLHGLSYIFNRKACLSRRSIWSVLVISASIATIYNIIHMIMLFTNKPLVVMVDVTRDATLGFPSVTICNFNVLKLSKVKPIRELVERMAPLSFEVGFTGLPNHTGQDYSAVSNYGWDNWYRDNSHQLSETIHSCKWENEDCGLENFTEVFTEMGLCYTFNSNGTVKARNAGRKYGLQLSLNALQEEYLRDKEDIYAAGFKVAIHPQGVPPLMSVLGVAVNTGTYNAISLTTKVRKDEARDVTKCGSKELQYFNTPYSVEACLLECETNYIYEKCKCRYLNMPNTDVPICNPPEYYDCLIPQLNNYIENERECAASCPEPCEETIYTTTISQSTMSDYFFNEYARVKGNTSDYWRKNYVKLEIYFSTMAYEYIEKRLAYTILELLCDIGGALGLVLGASVLTLVEILDFAIVRIFASPKRKVAAKEDATTNPDQTKAVTSIFSDQ